ncbi:GNAT family N-acetyltransferase [Endozoicomonas sp. SM1973]|uniref:GNAT family N-acetyltransferase n=1 Tax=Spartinivicinus marinus TaxID=2994442 RepID=A0A853I2G5_9GAMM|nr:GNAT family protein [Spartinivicinus marinus]MCX4026567.1 GNAT family protein [Spartinivicinus marinus]NYZ64404.1 GNAT family N-acetyltransferase [Spartinivicinus marinus]
MFVLEVNKTIKLELVHPAIAQQLYKLVESNRAYLSEWLPWVSKAESIEDYESFIKQVLYDYAAGKKMACSILFEGKLVGVCGFNAIEPVLKRAEIGYWIASEYQGKGIVTQVCQKLIEIAFDYYNVDKVQISAAKDNIRSRAICERLGMNLEGIITNQENVKGKIVDHAIYGLHKER